jgi:hypothetical protein
LLLDAPHTIMKLQCTYAELDKIELDKIELDKIELDKIELDKIELDKIKRNRHRDLNPIACETIPIYKIGS